MAKVLAVCISEKKGERKKPVESVELRENHGIVGDAHAGDCVMPKEGIFVKVITGGTVRSGDGIQTL